MIYAIMALAGGMSLISARNSFYPLKWATSFFWWALLIYWIGADILADGDPADVAIMLGIVFVAMLFLLWGMAGRKGKIEVQDELSSTGTIVRRILKYDKSKGKPVEPGRETAAEYQIKIRSKLRGQSNKRRR